MAKYYASTTELDADLKAGAVTKDEYDIAWARLNSDKNQEAAGNLITKGQSVAGAIGNYMFPDQPGPKSVGLQGDAVNAVEPTPTPSTPAVAPPKKDKPTLGKAIDTGVVGKKPALSKVGGQHSGGSSSRTNVSDMDKIYDLIMKKAETPPEGVDPAVYEAKRQSIEDKYEAQKDRVSKGELAATLGQALGLIVAGGGAAKIGDAFGKVTGLPGKSNMQGAGEYAGELLKRPAPDFSKQYERADSDAARQEKGVVAQEQADTNATATKTSAWKDKLQAAIASISGARVSTSTNEGTTATSDARSAAEKNREKLIADANHKRDMEVGALENEPMSKDTQGIKDARSTAIGRAAKLKRIPEDRSYVPGSMRDNPNFTQDAIELTNKYYDNEIAKLEGMVGNTATPATAPAKAPITASPAQVQAYADKYTNGNTAAAKAALVSQGATLSQ